MQAPLCQTFRFTNPTEDLHHTWFVVRRVQLTRLCHLTVLQKRLESSADLHSLLPSVVQSRCKFIWVDMPLCLASTCEKPGVSDHFPMIIKPRLGEAKPLRFGHIAGFPLNQAGHMQKDARCIDSWHGVKERGQAIWKPYEHLTIQKPRYSCISAPESWHLCTIHGNE